jgi:hypothetical protein
MCPFLLDFDGRNLCRFGQVDSREANRDLQLDVAARSVGIELHLFLPGEQAFSNRMEFETGQLPPMTPPQRTA